MNKDTKSLYEDAEGIQLCPDRKQLAVLMQIDTNNTLKEGDEVVATYFMSGFDTSEGVLFDDENAGLGYGLGEMTCTVEHAYQIVLKSEYVTALEAAGLSYPSITE